MCRNPKRQQGLRFLESQKIVYSYKRNNTNGMSYFNCKVLDSDADKFEHLRSTFFSDNHLHGNMFDESWLRNVEDKLTANLHPDYLQPPSIQIREEELDNALKESQTSKKSSDPDGIHPLMLRHTGTFFKIACLKLFNFCLHAGTYIWTIGKVIFLRKPHKENYTIANSYRPITLTSYVGKLFERIIERRLRKDLEAKGLIDDSQEGFRKRRGTGRCIYKLLDNIRKIIEQGKVVAALFIDLEKAFDSIFSPQSYLSFTLQKCSKNAKVKLKSTLMTPHMFQQVTR